MSVAGHVDPLDPAVPRPDPSEWGPRRQRAFRSPAMDAFREGMRLRGLPDLRAAVLDDLSAYFEIDAEEALYRATHSFELSSAEWNAKPERTNPDDIKDFYLHLQAWQFGLLWYSYLQAEGYAPPVAGIVADDMSEAPPAPVLDFGAGIGAAAAMFRVLGHEVALADISTPLLKFARFRMERRGLDASYIDLNEEDPPRDSFQVVAAIQTFAHVPDVAATARMLHRALRPGGSLYADFDVRPRSGSDSRLYDDDLPLRRAVQHAGFVQERALEGWSIRYRRVSPVGVAHMGRHARDAVMLGPLRTLYRRARYGR